MNNQPAPEKQTGLPYADPDWRAEFVDFVVASTDLERVSVAKIVETSAAEVSVGVKLIDDLLSPDSRILEVGAGIGLFSLDLHLRGFDIVALEPGANGFGDHARIAQALRQFVSGAEKITVIAREASGLNPEIDGEFDLIFSVNVMEHIPDLDANMQAMANVLLPQGVMVHTCPNYHVPYEPHYALILVPFAPKVTAFFKTSLSSEELWKSLNFITHRRVSRIARKLDLEIEFQRGIMHTALVRLDEDPIFAARQSRSVRLIYRILKGTGLLWLLRHLPPQLATPMSFQCRPIVTEDFS